MAQLPPLLRTVLVGDMPDADWAATQVAPAASICVDVSPVSLLGAFFLAYDASGVLVNPSGNIDVALVDVASTVPKGGVASKVVVKTTPIDSAVVAGAGLQYDVSGSCLVTLRINAEALAGTVAYVEIYTNALV